jgi:hypothetical protein
MDENNGLGVDFKVTSYPADINGMTLRTMVWVLILKSHLILLTLME